MDDVLLRLKAALGDRYEVEREIGRGGMANVYLARDLRHGRSVAIKVLEPKLSERVGQEAFLNEMQVTARLMHPLILPLHDSGSADGLLYYVMPFVDGETLRDRLRREGQLSITEAVRIAREVADALAYAHEKNVVHRDIKPENILLTGGHAMVADFGIARALQIAGDRTVRLGEGVSGTPAYMSPEQAMGEPGDGRSDVYSLGCVLYEMLAGNPPFMEPTASALMKRVMVETPVSIRNHRSTVPESLAQIIAQCLEKIPADRWGTAAELGAALSGVQDTQRTITPLPSPSPSSGALALRVGGLLMGFAASSFLVLLLARALIRQLGLPDWVLSATVVVLALGLPVLLVTLFNQTRLLRYPVSGTHRWLTWRNAILGGGFAFLALILLVSGYMLSRKTGIGPGASLVSAGVLQERDHILIAEFENATPESLLGATVKEALSVDLSQSPSVTIVPASQIADGLQRMQRDPKSPLKVDLARELAVREGVKAVMTGELRTLGKGYVLSAKLVSPQSSEVLLAEREDADGPEELIQAVDRLSKKLREHIGESLKSIRANKPLEQVTTSSLAALQKYSQAVYATEMEGNDDKAIALLAEAVKLDSTFAMAYRKWAVILINSGREPAQAYRTTVRAFELRNRLPDRERYLTEGQYYDLTGEPEKAALAFQNILDMNPNDAWALNNLGVEYQAMGDFEKFLEYSRRSDAVAPSGLTLGNIIGGEADLGRYGDAEKALQDFMVKYPGNLQQINEKRLFLSLGQGQYDRAESTQQAGLEIFRQSPFLHARTVGGIGMTRALRGRLGEAERHFRLASAGYVDAGMKANAIRPMMNWALMTLLIRNDPQKARAVMDEALAKTPLESLDPTERPVFEVVYVYAMSGDLTKARALLAEYERTIDPLIQKTQERFSHGSLGAILLAEHRPQEAIQEFELDRAKQAFDRRIDLPLIARAYEMMNMPDSALVFYERFVTTPQYFRLRNDALFLASSLLRLGELHEVRGDRTRAIEYYSRFAELWKNADPELQPRVSAVKSKLEALAMGGRS